jgi:hypothetical protein
MKAILALVLALVPTVSAQVVEVPPSDAQAHALLEQDFTTFNPQYKHEWPVRVARIRDLAARVYTEESKGLKNSCGHQILFEIEELMVTSADFKQIDKRLDDLDATIGHPSSDKQDSDGMWGSCSEQWYLKLYHTYDRLEDEARQNENKGQPLPAFLNRVSTPDKLTAYLDALSVSDVQHTGIDHGLEFNEALSVLLRVIVHGNPQGYTIDPALSAALLDRVLNRYRNPKTGFWGERYRRGDHEDFQDDLSMTFHIVSFLHGKVPDMPRIIDTTLALKDMDYPVGWLWKGAYWNHNNMDVVTLFRYGWPSASPSQRSAMSAEIERMLVWCLKDSLQQDGSFKVNIADASIENAEYYGAAFLSRIGFFEPSLRFWTNREFPESTAIKKRIYGFVQQHQSSSSGDDNYRSVIEQLDAK